MRHLAKALAMFRPEPLDPEDARRMQLDREWRRLRANATSPSEVAEIDAIFARNL